MSPTTKKNKVWTSFWCDNCLGSSVCHPCMRSIPPPTVQCFVHPYRRILRRRMQNLRPGQQPHANSREISTAPKFDTCKINALTNWRAFPFFFFQQLSTPTPATPTPSRARHHRSHHARRPTPPPPPRWTGARRHRTRTASTHNEPQSPAETRAEDTASDAEKNTPRTRPPPPPQSRHTDRLRRRQRGRFHRPSHSAAAVPIAAKGCPQLQPCGANRRTLPPRSSDRSALITCSAAATRSRSRHLHGGHERT